MVLAWSSLMIVSTLDYVFYLPQSFTHTSFSLFISLFARFYHIHFHFTLSSSHSHMLRCFIIGFYIWIWIFKRGTGLNLDYGLLTCCKVFLSKRSILILDFCLRTSNSGWLGLLLLFWVALGLFLGSRLCFERNWLFSASLSSDLQSLQVLHSFYDPFQFPN